MNKYLGAFKNRSQIWEGIRNNVFKKEHIEAEAALRWSICKECDSLGLEGSNCVVPKTQPCCKECGCSLAIKTRSMSSSCPLGKWKAILDEDQEIELIKTL